MYFKLFLFSTLFTILILAAICLLQVYLSKSRDQWLGLILPLVSFLNSIRVCIDASPVHRVPTLYSIFIGFANFIWYNILTVILIMIYINYHKCRRR